MDWVDRPKSCKSLYGILQLLQGSHLDNFPRKTLKLNWVAFHSVSFQLKCLRPRHTMRQIAATHRSDKSPRLHCCCDKAACAYFVPAICRTNSNWFEFVPQIAATKFCRSDVKRGDLLQQPVAATCRIVCLGL